MTGIITTRASSVQTARTVVDGPVSSAPDINQRRRSSRLASLDSARKQPSSRSTKATQLVKCRSLRNWRLAVDRRYLPASSFSAALRHRRPTSLPNRREKICIYGMRFPAVSSTANNTIQTTPISRRSLQSTKD